MPLSPHEQNYVDQFWRATEPRMPGYTQASLSCLAVKTDSDRLLIRGRLHLAANPPNLPATPFESEHVIAGHWKLETLGKTAKDIVEELLSGKLQTPCGPMVLPPDPNNPTHPYSAAFDSHYGRHLDEQRRRFALSIRGGSNSQPHPSQFYWELKGLGFGDLETLCVEFGIPNLPDSQACVDAVAENLVQLQEASTIIDSRAIIQITLASGLEPKKVSLVLTIRMIGDTPCRKPLPSAEINWTKHANAWHGKSEFAVPAGSVLECVAKYAGEVHHFSAVTDLSTTRNARRAIHLAFDPNLERMGELLKIEGRGKEARDFEKPIAWLFGMLGFNTSMLDDIPKANGVPDLIATTPKGNVMTIECTTGSLKADRKLQNLVARNEMIKKALGESGFEGKEVLPVIVTNRTKNYVQGDLEDAKKARVHVITSDDFPDLLKLIESPPDPDAFFDRARQQVVGATKPDPFAPWPI